MDSDKKTKYNLINTKTAENLAKAFVGECQAIRRYELFAEKARGEKLQNLEKIFTITASDERGHAEMFFEYLTQGLPPEIIKPEIIVFAKMGTTFENLEYAAEGENLEWTDLYQEFGKIAQQEGFIDIATSFFDIASVEKHHDKRFRHFIERMKNNQLFSLPKETIWYCTNCGFHVKGKEAPKKCPACHHPQSFYLTIFDEQFPFES